MTFVFRNNTIERFFPGEYQFSGYGDISYIPAVNEYIWWYQMPLKFDRIAIDEEVHSYINSLQLVLNKIDTKPIIVVTMDVLYDTQLTMDDCNLYQIADEYNSALYQLAKTYHNIRIIDIRNFYRQYTQTELLDWRFWMISQMGINPRLLNTFTEWWNRQGEVVALKRKKCLILDLDNTLWGGILGEDGVDGIQMSGDYPGKAYHFWQEGIRELQKSGIILCICSKNNESDVEEVWKHREDMVLRKEHFAACRINWNDKAQNIRELAQELNIGLDAMVFVDDNPSERELIRQQLPMVSVPEWVKQPYELPILYKHLVETYFKVYQLTAEDAHKTEQYRQNAQRAQMQTQFSNLDDFIASLYLQLKIEKIQPQDGAKITRVAQMTQKTNQFNLTTYRYTEQEIINFLQRGGDVWILSVQDRFGDYGISGLLMMTSSGVIDTLLMSCRILGKGIEDAFVRYVIAQYRGKLQQIEATYLPTEKNSMVMDFYPHIGFSTNRIDDQMRCYWINPNSANLNIKNIYNIK